MTRLGRVRDLFAEALEREADARAAYLERACGDDSALREEVESLLSAHEAMGPVDRLEGALTSALRRPPEDGGDGSGALEPGSEVGRYRIEEVLGGGGMGIVYRARDPRLGRPVAIKLLSRRLSGDREARDRLLVEARAAAALDHPNLCPIHEIGEAADGRLFLVMPCYAGRTLARRLEEGALSLEEAVDIALKAGRGLAEAHRAGFIHRDIKPANLMLTADGGVKILDFGLALRAGASDPAGRAGTVAYMSPEQVRGEELDPRTDVWSAGVVLYEMLAGRRPFGGADDAAVMKAVLVGEREPLAACRPEAPPALAGVVERAMSAARPERPRDGGALLAALVEAAGPILSAGSGDGPGRTGEPSLLPHGERRQVTVLHGRLEGSPPGIAGRTAAELRAAVRRIVARHGGVVARWGDGIVEALFGVPATHEDDPLRAARAAAELRREVEKIGREGGGALKLRVGLDTGSVAASPTGETGRPYSVAGDPVEGAAALAARADAGRTLASAECRRRLSGAMVLEPSAPVDVPDRPEPLRSYSVGPEIADRRPLGVESDARLTAFVGRESELAALETSLERAQAGEGSLVTVTGEAGVGKSRLLLEFRRRIPSGRVALVQARCPSYGAAAYRPLVDAFRDRLALGSEAERPRAERVAAAVWALDPDLEEFLPLYLHLLSLPGSESRLPRHLEGEHLRVAMMEAISSLFTLGSVREPTAMLLEDWHWADPASAETLRKLAEMGSAYPLLIVLTCRPGHVLDWSHVARHRPLHVGPLSAAESAAVARSVLGAERLAPELAGLLHDRTGGNPFFLEEVSRGLSEVGAVRVRGGEASPSGSLEGLRLPDTVQGVIRARLDRLGRAAREALACASVIGREFSRPLLERVAPEGLDLEAALGRLRELGLVQQVRVLPVPSYRFQHVLTEEVAHDSLLEARRRELHGRAGRALEELYAGRLEEHLDRLVHHFARAGRWEEAVRYGLEACRRAASLSRFSEALDMGDRVLGWIDRLPADDENERTRIDLLFRQERLGETLGLRDRQRALIGELVERLERRGENHLLVEALVRRGDLHTLVREFDPAERALEEALRVARSIDDPTGVRHALRSLGLLRWHQGRDEEAVEVGRESLAINEARGDVGEVVLDLSNLGIVLRGMGRLEEAREHLERALELAEGRGSPDDLPPECSFILHNLANVHREAGRDDLALACLERGLALHRGQGVPIKDSYGLTAVGNIRLSQGRVEESLELYRKALEECRKARNAVGHSQSARILGEVLLGLGRVEEAIPCLREAAEVFRRLEDASSRALMLRHLARAHEEAGHRAEAVATWSDVRRLCESRSDVPGALEALGGLARSFRSTDAGLSRRYYEEGLELASRSGDREREASLLNGLGILEWRSGEPARALQAYERSLALFRELGDGPRIGLALNSIAACLRDLGRPGEALAPLAQALEVHERTGKRLLAGHARSVLGDVHRALGHPAEAARAYEASLEVRRELGDAPGEAWMLVRLAELRSEAGDGEGARELSRRARSVHTRGTDEELEAALAALPDHD
ncbi:MAG TPA: tetratricopeptide repeat protein [Gemmatimonadota bacterium]|nr:tetratricopeptide repeat protein [Gemmatimonadota bacterium]